MMPARRSDLEGARTVIWFSCGVASAVAAKLVIEERRRSGTLNDVVVARCIVREEHEDNDRFASDCEKWFDYPITNLINAKYDGSIYEVFRRESYISGISGAPCTRLLKKRIREEFERPTDTHVFGYCAEETNRFDAFLDANNIHAVCPLIERGLTHADCMAIVKDTGIKLPAMYLLGYKHNNCRGCSKAQGQGYWNKIRQDFPEMFNRMAAESRRLGVRIIKIDDERRFLDEIIPGAGNYQEEPEVQCGIFCELAKQEIR